MPFPFKIFLILSLCFCVFRAPAQRTYLPASVLANGNWFKIATTQAGVYKMDLPFLNSLGFSGAIPSAQIRIFGNGGGMLPEANATPRIDDLEENDIWVEDGGDGVLNGSDYILFFASGPDHWEKDSINRKFSHKKNLFSNRSFYFITVGGAGKRVAPANFSRTPVATSVSFDERYFYELDSVNFLSSGKEWFGEEFSSLPGRSLSRSFSIPFPDLVPGTASVETAFAGRSVNQPMRFMVAVNGQQVQQVTVPAIGLGQYDVFAQQVRRADAFQLTQSTAAVGITLEPGSFNSQGWLNWLEFFSRRNLVLPAAGQLPFRDWNTLGLPSVQFQVANAGAGAQVWDVTDPLHPQKMNSSVSGNILSFVNDARQLREYVVFSNNFFTPAAIGKVANQNLHATSADDFLIVTHPDFLGHAERLAGFHRAKNNLRVAVVTTEQVFNEFAGGNPDPTAIRDFVKMYYDKYKTTWNQSGKYLLLFGKGSFDYKNRVSNNSNFVPAYESTSSLDPLSTYTSDDFFGFLDDNEDINSAVVLNQLDIGIGRIPATNAQEAKNFVDKLFDYHSPEAFGAWRNNLNFIADDEDNNLHLQDAEVLSATVSSTAPVFNNIKIYLDAFHQESSYSGGRYPQVNAAVNNNIFNGTLIWNYSGHGGPERLAEEVVIDHSIVNTWKNPYRLPLFITATCDFAPYDNPVIHSLGEELITRAKSGAIALMTTSRVVFAYSNRVMNDNYLRIALQKDSLGRYKSLGEAVQAAKNFTYQTFGDINNNRKFSLLGDPAMTLGFPELKVTITAINGDSRMTDTLSAMEPVKMEGTVSDNRGNFLNDFNGTAALTIFDKPRTVTTLANDGGSFPQAFSEQTNVLFKGKATVRNGKFSFQFKMPRDINYQYGNGKISLYAHDAGKDGNGFSAITIGGIASNVTTDRDGPTIKAFLNDEHFVNGSIVNAAPVLVVKLFDSSGINTGSSGIDHDIIATLDNNNSKYFLLNNFYETDVDDFQKGTVRFQLPELSPGVHSLRIKAWDVMNNSGEYVLNFTVVSGDKLQLDHVLNYPNPFTSNTNFWFEHNAPGLDLQVKIEIFSISGKLIKTIAETINTPGNRSHEIAWNGTDDHGNKIGRGVYVYRIRVRSADGRSAEKWERLAVLK